MVLEKRSWMVPYTLRIMPERWQTVVGGCAHISRLLNQKIMVMYQYKKEISLSTPAAENKIKKVFFISLPVGVMRL